MKDKRILFCLDVLFPAVNLPVQLSLLSNEGSKQTQPLWCPKPCTAQCTVRNSKTEAGLQRRALHGTERPNSSSSGLDPEQRFQKDPSFMSNCAAKEDTLPHLKFWTKAASDFRFGSENTQDFSVCLQLLYGTRPRDSKSSRVGWNSSKIQNVDKKVFVIFLNHFSTNSTKH